MSSLHDRLNDAAADLTTAQHTNRKLAAVIAELWQHANAQQRDTISDVCERHRVDIQALAYFS